MALAPSICTPVGQSTTIPTMTSLDPHHDLHTRRSELPLSIPNMTCTPHSIAHLLADAAAPAFGALQQPALRRYVVVRETADGGGQRRRARETVGGATSDVRGGRPMAAANAGERGPTRASAGDRRRRDL
jgi:hypothetical protein